MSGPGAEESQPVSSPETKRNIPRFSEETKRVLESNGYSIINLHGYSLEQLRDLGFPWVERLIDRLGEVQKGMNLSADASQAELLNQSLVQAHKESGNLPTTSTGHEQQIAVDFNNLYTVAGRVLLDKNHISDARCVIMDDISTYAELAYLHYKDTGQPLFVDRKPKHPLEGLKSVKRALMEQPSGNTGALFSPLLEVEGLRAYLAPDETAAFKQGVDGMLSVVTGSKGYLHPITKHSNMIIPENTRNHTL